MRQASLVSTFATEKISRLILFAGAGLILCLSAACDIDGETYELRFLNDTSGIVTIQRCRDAACNKLQRGRALAPGESLTTTGVVDMEAWWRASDDDGASLGCFHVDFRSRPSSGLFRVSESTVCPRS
jgi:hypothetical protein